MRCALYEHDDSVRTAVRLRIAFWMHKPNFRRCSRHNPQVVSGEWTGRHGDETRRRAVPFPLLNNQPTSVIRWCSVDYMGRFAAIPY